ncbi:membrane protein [Spirochaetia bacterium]|nr:membrane protein [Spirochaetia bacterium]GHV80096.1 membrane protein [Spirochaetia bacterium]
MNKVLNEKIVEAFSSVLPITVIVLIASIIFVPMSAGIIVMFLVGAALLIVGMGFFTLGADMAMMPMGEGIGAELTKGKNVFLAVGISFLMGLIITIAEPDLMVLALQLAKSLNIQTLIVTVGVGVGLFMAIAVLRVIIGVPLRFLLLFFYAVTFALAFYMASHGATAFVPVSFDSGGVTTGPITVPFMLAMCAGVASLRGDKGAKSDSFGFAALCSIGPIMAVMLLGMALQITEVPPNSLPEEKIAAIAGYTDRDVVKAFVEEFPETIKNVGTALGAILVFFFIFQLITRRFHRRQLGRIVIGFVYTFIGLVVFLTGVEVGFIPVGSLFGSELGASPIKWVLIPLAMIIGYFIVAAEPAVHVLNKQVEDVSQGAITQKVMAKALAIGMSLALGIAMARILFNVSILYILVPGYVFALVLTFFVPPIFTGIAFDSGGVCSGPMTSTFLLPFAIGACASAGHMEDAFGIVAMVAMTPLVVVQLLGLIYRKQFAAIEAPEADVGMEGVVVFEEAYYYG